MRSSFHFISSLKKPLLHKGDPAKEEANKIKRMERLETFKGFIPWLVLWGCRASTFAWAYIFYDI